MALGIDEGDAVLVGLEGRGGVAAEEVQLLLEHLRADPLALECALLLLPVDELRRSLQHNHVRRNYGLFLEEGGLEAGPRKAIEHITLHLRAHLLDLLHYQLRRSLLVCHHAVCGVHTGLAQQVAGADVLQPEGLRDALRERPAVHSRRPRDDDLQRARRMWCLQAVQQVLERICRLPGDELLEQEIEHIVGAVRVQVLVDVMP
mmetsp:Transcript_22464/g.63204  ORF Transcript_22464/g.63204 Transcript_22464/m.63204 type:complete len:204 (-) Transcript_22464:133-744(-)